jgi:hypothetical protein
MHWRSLITDTYTRGALPLAAMLATAVGYYTQSILDPMQLQPLRLLLIITVLVNVLAAGIWLLRRDVPLALLSACAWVAATIYYIGFAPSAATLLLVLAAMAAGSLLIAPTLGATAALACGLALLVSLVSWSLPFHIHCAALYYTIGLSLIAWRAIAVRQMLSHAARTIATQIGQMPVVALLAVNVVGLCATPLWLPTMQSDDIAYHLALPTQLQQLGYYRMGIDESLWALAPWASDVLHGMVQVLAGMESRGAVNLLWMSMLYSGVWLLGTQFRIKPALLALVIALHASVPITSSMLGGMQTELPSAALFVVLLYLISLDDRLSGKRLCGIAALAGLLMACKLSNAFLLLPAAAWLLSKNWKTVPLRPLPVAVLIGALVALPSFVYAQLVADNPFLPFLNGHFQSPYAPLVNWSDTSWKREITPLLPWQLTFNTSDYLSATNGAAGFIYMYIFVGLFPALYYRSTRALALVGIAAFMLIFIQIQYVRYTHPATAVLLLASTAGYQLLTRRTAPVLLSMVALCAMNLSVINSGYWHLRHKALETLVAKGQAATVEQYAPQRSVAQYLRTLDANMVRVIFHNVDSQGNAELTIPTSTTSWYNPRLSALRANADADASGNQWISLLLAERASHLVVDRNKVSPGLENALKRLGKEVVFKKAIYDVWQLDSDSELTSELLHSGSDYIKLRYRDQVDAGHITFKADFSCSLPGEPLVLTIASREKGQSADKTLLSGWAMCNDDNLAHGLLAVDLPETERTLTFTAVPRSPMEFSLEQVQATLVAGGGAATEDPATELLQRLFHNDNNKQSMESNTP